MVSFLSSYFLKNKNNISQHATSPSQWYIYFRYPPFAIHQKPQPDAARACTSVREWACEWACCFEFFVFSLDLASASDASCDCDAEGHSQRFECTATIRHHTRHKWTLHHNFRRRNPESTGMFLPYDHTGPCLSTRWYTYFQRRLCGEQWTSLHGEQEAVCKHTLHGKHLPVPNPPSATT